MDNAPPESLCDKQILNSLEDHITRLEVVTRLAQIVKGEDEEGLYYLTGLIRDEFLLLKEKYYRDIQLVS